MPTVNFLTHDGQERIVEAEAGSSLMQAAVDNGIDEILAECGGACSCATCHCYIDPAWANRLEAADDTEKQLVECALNPNEFSRLSCQVTVTEELDGIVVNLPESQF